MIRLAFKTTACAAIAAVFVFLVAPIFIAGSVSFTADESMTFPPHGFSLRWYEQIAGERRWQRAITNTMMVGAMCAAMATVIGTLSAYGISKIGRPGLRDAVLVLFLTPLAVPYMSLGMALYPIFADLGLIGTRFGVALAQSVIALPFVVVAVTSTIRRRDRALEQAARTLGATAFQSFIHVVLPLLAPGIAAGFILAFMTSFDDIIMPIFLSGFTATTVPKEMLDSLYQSGDPSVMAASTAVSTVGLALFLLATMLGRRRR